MCLKLQQRLEISLLREVLWVSDGNQISRCWEEMDEPGGRGKDDLAWAREQKSWLGKWRLAAIQRHLNERKKSDVRAIPMTILQNAAMWNTQMFCSAK